MYKSIIKAVGVAAVAVVFSVGCISPDDPCQTDESGQLISSEGCKEELEPDEYKLTIATTSGGSVSPDVGEYYYDAGTSVTVTATADDGYTFSKWSGASSSTNAKITITMNNNKTLTANFLPQGTTGGGGGSGNGLVGDWSVVETASVRDGESHIEQIPDDYKMFFSFKSSSDLVVTYFEQIADFWIESVNDAGKYSIKGDSICVNGDCMKYSVSGNTLTIIETYESCDSYNGVENCGQRSYSYKAVRGNIANTRSSLGNDLKSQDPALNRTEWRPQEWEYEWERIQFWGNYYYDNSNVYISNSYDVTWYTSGNRLTLVALECDSYETVNEGGHEYDRCVSKYVSQTVPLDYQLSDGKLRLRRVGSTKWDVYIPYNDITDPCVTNPDECDPGGTTTNEYTLTIAATSGGSVSPAVGTYFYDAGTSVTVTATANNGYTFSNGSGASADTSDEITITMNGNKTLTANFQPSATGGGGDIVGDWSIVEMTSVRDGVNSYETIPDDTKMFYSFKSSNDLVATGFNKIGDFWIESIEIAEKYNIKGDSICVDGDCMKYSISGNTLTLSNSYEDCYGDYDGYYGCQLYSYSVKAVKSNLASTRSSLGNSLKSQDPALNHTEWERLSPPDTVVCDWCENDRIEFWGNYYYDSRNVYISGSDDITWYTEGGNRLTLVALECDRYEHVYEDGYEWERCASTSVDKTVTLDYQLTNGTLLLKAPGRDWDVWTPYSYSWDYDGGLYKSKAKAKSQKSKRFTNPLFKVSKK